MTGNRRSRGRDPDCQLSQRIAANLSKAPGGGGGAPFHVSFDV